MIEPLDDELGDYVGAFKQVERPTAAARAATWAAIDARLAADEAAAHRLERPVLAALAAAVVLCIGVAAAVARGTRTAGDVAASHHTGAPAPAALEPPHPKSLESIAHDAEPHESPDSPGEAGEAEPRESPSEAESRESPSPGAAESRESPSPGAAESPDSPPTDAITPTERSLSRPRTTSSSNRRERSVPSLRPEEVASFRRAQAALAEDRGADALQALDDHGRRFPGGLFEEERQISRAAALCLLGREAEARAARDRFLRTHPGSHLTERARSICREIE